MFRRHLLFPTILLTCALGCAGRDSVVSPTARVVSDTGEALPFVLPTPQRVQYGPLLELKGWNWSPDGLSANLVEEVRSVCGDPLDDGLPLRLALNAIDDMATSFALSPAVSTQAYRLVVDSWQCEIRAAGEVGLAFGLQSLRGLHVRLPDGRTAIRAARIQDWPAFSTRGLIGGPVLIPSLAEAKFNLLQYPAAREELPPTQIEEYREATQKAAARNLRFLAHLGYHGQFGDVTPGFDEKGLDYLREYYARRYDWGAREFTVGYDDMTIPPGEGAEWGQNHARATLAVHESLRALDSNIRTWFIPVAYGGLPTSEFYGASAKDGADYLKSAGALLPEEIEIFWTGRHVFSPVVENADADAIATLIGRPPFFWDNDALAWIEKGMPLTGRPGDFHQHVRGYVANVAGVEQRANAPAVILTIADYLWNPAAYHPATAYERARRYISIQAQLPGR